ncbi:Xaa-Pro peptidase family protein [uncultured Desulfuromonas sp.]|uniref:M24 family metallopeptidase n=1 Tax=uncultured Desulfuromonas sp. TaxID=181013 RepID=UPI002AAB9346|nr:Xaa-Pro peptidase family protein [uncultured Desulfuromonas sp.]
MSDRVPVSELSRRLERFRQLMDQHQPDWELAAIFGKINHYYFTGTMQDGVLLIPRDADATYWVRRSFQRATEESAFADIRPMGSFRDAAETFSTMPKTLHVEMELLPLAGFERFKKHFPVEQARPVDGIIARVRAVKSPFELDLMRESGRIHQRVLEQRVPELLKLGISEAEFASQLYPVMVEEGHHGIARFSMFETEILLGQIGFGESSIYPTSFDGPGGNYGMNPAVPLLGSRDRRLKRGDLVFVDIGCGVNGYHTDKTMTYLFGTSATDEMRASHDRCVEIQNEVARRMVPGAIPSQIYTEVIATLDDEFLRNFMGYGDRQARFLAHGIGLYIDEYPVIAKGFDEPLEEGMVMAIEPKRGIEHVGMVGIENTFIVTPSGGECITGDHPGLMDVPCYE